MFGPRVSVAVTSALVLLGAAMALPAASTSLSAPGEIAFSVQHGDNDAPWDIYVVRADGRSIVKTKTRLQEDRPVWSPDGARIAYVAWAAPPYFSGTHGWVYTMHPDGTHRQRIAHGYAPQWSPDGRRIAYAYDGIYVADPDGTHVTRLTNHALDPEGFPTDFDPHWSADGTHIAFTRLGRGKHDVYVVPSSGGAALRVTRTGDSQVEAWAPGHTIVFMRDQGIYLVDADGSGLRKLASRGAYDTPTIGGWSRDGRLVLYGDARGIATIRPSDGHVQRLARKGRAPAWGPGDATIAYVVSIYADERHAGIWIMNRDGSGAHRIATAFEECYSPAWASR